MLEGAGFGGVPMGRGEALPTSIADEGGRFQPAALAIAIRIDSPWMLPAEGVWVSLALSGENR